MVRSKYGNQIRVLLYSALPQKRQGGIAIWTETFLRHAKDFNVTCTLVNNAAQGRRLENPEASISLVDEFFRTIRIFQDLKKALKREPFDIAHVNTSCSPLGIIRDAIVLRTIRKYGIPVVTHFHCDIPFWVRNRVSELFLKYIICNSKMRIVLCNNSEKYIKCVTGKDSIIIPNFINSDIVSEKKTLNIKITKILYVGGVQPDKGCYEIFEVAKSFPNISFVMVGQKSKEFERIAAPENVELRGPLNHESVLELMDDCDVFLFPSHSEGFSLSVAESMARGMAIIATDVGANAQMIENNGGIIVPVENVTAIENAIQQMSDPVLRKSMSEWNINKVKTSYTTEIVMQELKKMYVEAVKENLYDYI